MYHACKQDKTGKPEKIGSPPFNILISLSASYDDVVQIWTKTLFPTPPWKKSGASYELTTSDGARILIGTWFNDFPFNISKSDSWPAMLSQNMNSSTDIQAESDVNGEFMNQEFHSEFPEQDITRTSPLSTPTLTIADFNSNGVFGNLDTNTVQNMFSTAG
mgnify:CR=1 FL=1